METHDHDVCRSSICAGSCGKVTSGPFSLKRSPSPSLSRASTPDETTPDEAADAPASRESASKRLRRASTACTRQNEDGVVCGKTFAKVSYLSRHVRAVHDKLKDFKCTVPDCTYVASRQTHLTQHVRDVHDKLKNFKCTVPDCTYVASRQTHLTRHVRAVHDKMKNFRCSVPDCTYVASRQTHLTRHVRAVHDKIKDFKCTVPDCTYTASQQADLTRHVRAVHDKIKGFKCSFEGCTFATSWQDALTVHMLIHTNEFPHPCKVAGCSAKFRQAQQLKNHAYYYHTTEGNASRKRKETAIEKLLTQHGIQFTREHRIDLGCAIPEATWVYTDFVLIFQNTLVILEVDQDQHDGYGIACDLRRMTDIVASLRISGNTMRVAFVRYNPDGFKVAGNTKRTTTTTRHERLISVLRGLGSETVDDATLCDTRIWYLFYDVEADGKPSIFQDTSYADAVKEWLVEAHTD